MKERRHHNNTAQKRVREDKLYLSTQKIADKLGVPYDPIKAVTEAEFALQVEQLFNLFHWHWAHFRPARTEQGWRTPVAGMGKGFPDYIAIRGNRLLVIEIKSEKGEPTLEQEEWLDKFLGGGNTFVYLWRPSDYESIVEELR